MLPCARITSNQVQRDFLSHRNSHTANCGNTPSESTLAGTAQIVGRNHSEVWVCAAVHPVTALKLKSGADHATKSPHEAGFQVSAKREKASVVKHG
jgi:hypothetical protein